jgi:hypothetical protein
MDLFGLLTPELAKHLFSQAAQSDLTQKLFIIGICWKVMGKKIASHFKGMEGAVVNVGNEVKDLKVAVQADFKAQSARLQVLEEGMFVVKQRVTYIEGETRK